MAISRQTSTVTTEWEVGRPILFEGTWDRRKYLDRGTVLAFDPEKTLRYNMWSKLSRLPDTPENYTVVGFEPNTKRKRYNPYPHPYQLPDHMPYTATPTSTG